MDENWGSQVLKYVRGPYFENFIIFQMYWKLAKIGYFAIFLKKVFISESDKDRAKWTKICDHNGYNL